MVELSTFLWCGSIEHLFLPPNPLLLLAGFVFQISPLCCVAPGCSRPCDPSQPCCGLGGGGSVSTALLELQARSRMVYERGGMCVH